MTLQSSVINDDSEQLNDAAAGEFQQTRLSSRGSLLNEEELNLWRTLTKHWPTDDDTHYLDENKSI